MGYCTSFKGSLKLSKPLTEDQQKWYDHWIQVKKIRRETKEKISLATVYNTVQSFEKRGYLKEIAINSEKRYFDTNVSDHHHFYDDETKELIDLHNFEVGPIKISKKIPGKKIKSVEVLVKVETDNQNQK